MRLLLASLLLAASPATAAPIPKHLFPSDPPIEIGKGYERHGVKYTVYDIQGDWCFVKMGEINDRLVIVFPGPLSKEEVRELMRGREPELVRFRERY